MFRPKPWGACPSGYPPFIFLGAKRGRVAPLFARGRCVAPRHPPAQNETFSSITTRRVVIKIRLGGLDQKNTGEGYYKINSSPYV